MKPSYIHLLFIGSLVLLSGCGSGSEAALEERSDMSELRVHPHLPQANLLEATAENNLDELPRIPKRPKNPDLNDQKVISMQHLDDQHYDGPFRQGTPDSWKQKIEHGQEIWMSESYARTLEEERVASICEETGGEYQFSCSETDREDCSHGPSMCVCPEFYPTVDAFDIDYPVKDYPGDEGCLLYDPQLDEFPVFNQEDEEKGYSTGPKKLLMPVDWSPYAGEPGKYEGGWADQNKIK